MRIQDEVLKMLQQNGANYTSGQELCDKLVCSRTAVWKAVEQLRKSGYVIDALTNCGYRLTGGNPLNRNTVEKYLDSPCPLLVFDDIDSTNTYVKKMAEEGSPEGTVVISAYQSAGRGRMGRSFYSPHGSGIYMSFLLRPQLSPSDASLITTAASVAVTRAIRRVCGVDCGIKWVNDIFLNGKKICGILTEASLDFESGTLSYAVLGIGINVYMPDGSFPDELRDIAGAIYNTPPEEPEISARLAAAVINEFYAIYPTITDRSFIDEYRRLSVIVGHDINVMCGNKVYPAHAVSIDDDAHLIVTHDGITESLSSGEVSIRLIRE